MWSLCLSIICCTLLRASAQSCGAAALGPPSFVHVSDPVTGSLYEDDPAETIVAEVYAVGYPHCQSTVRYRAVAVTSYALTYFDVDPSSGEVKRTSNPRPALRSAWRDSTWTITIETYYDANDMPSTDSFDSINVVITVLQSNTDPFFPPSDNPSNIDVMETTGVGTVVRRFSAMDDDHGRAGLLEYSLYQDIPDELTEGGQHFSVIKETADVYVNRGWSLIVGEMFTYTITATDSGTPSRSANHTFNINIVSVPAKEPIFLHTERYHFLTPEVPDGNPAIICSTSGTFNDSEQFVGNVLAVDGDTLLESDITYSITGWTPQTGQVDFHIYASGADGGDIFICKSPNREFEPEYILTVQATDVEDPSKISTVRVYVNITDVNEPPFFLRSHFYGEVSEYSIMDTVVVDHLEAQDLDYGVNAQLSYSINDTSITAYDVYNDPVSRPGDFTIETDTGFIHKNVDLSTLETLRNYYFMVIVTDGGSLTDSTIVYLKIVDINDNEPVFEPAVYSASICENVGSDVLLFNFRADDYDLILSGTLNFSVTGLQSEKVQSREWHAEYPQPNSHDDVINTGNLYATMAFDYEEAATVNLLLIGYDRTPNPLSGTATVTINICDVNDHPPVFEHSSYQLSLRENATYPQSILQLRVTDADAAPHNTSTLSIAGFRTFGVDTAHNADGYFNLNLIDELDVETQDRCHTLTITATNSNGAVASGCRDATTDASDACTGSTLTDTATVMICVEDVNEFCPVISPVTYAATIDENSVHGFDTTIDIQATDADMYSPNNDFTFYIVAGSSDSVLHVDPASGQVFVDNEPDFEDQQTHTLTVGVYDNGEKGPNYPVNSCPLAMVTVTITNLNDEPPVCVACPYEFYCVQENSASAGDLVGSISVTDRDLVPLTAGFPIHMLTATIVADDSNGAFAIDMATNPNDDGRFDIRVSDLGPGMLDYETTDRHNLVIEVSDTVHTIQVHVTIHICDDNDQCPVFDANIPHAATVSECPNGNAGGHVTTVVATDTDTNQQNTTRYVITAGNSLGRFVIGPQSGEIHISDTGVDAETPPNSYTLTVTAMDTGNMACANTIDITITVTDCNDNKPCFTLPVTYTARCEGDSVNSIAATFTVEDMDQTAPNNEYNVEIVTGTNGPLMGGVPPFKLVDNDIQFNTDMIDREDASVFRDANGNAVFYPSIRAVDQGTPPLSCETDLIIHVCDINDNCPKFVPALPAPAATGEHYRRLVAEHSPYHATDHTQSTQVISLAAFDPDFGANSRLVWSIANDGCAGLFDIDASTGIVFVAASLSNRGNSGHCCDITVQVDDASGCIGPPTAIIKVCISDINNNCPMIAVDESDVSYPENESASAAEIVVKSITITDADSSPNAELSVRIENPSGITTDAFPFYLTNLGPSVGNLTTELRLRGPTDHEDVSRYDILIIATDRVASEDDPGHTCQEFTHLTVTINDVIDEPPVLTDAHFVGYVFENEPTGTIISLDPGISAHDLDVVLTPDVPPDSVSFSLQPGTPPFTITTTDLTNGLYHGVVRTNEMFDFETDPSYMFEVVATDGDGLTDTGTVTVFVLDRNDNPPMCNRTVLRLGGYNFADVTYLGTSTCFARVRVCEDAVIDHRILNVAFFDVFYDLDSGNNAEMYFDVQHVHINNNPADFPQEFEDDFGIRQQDLLVITQELDYERLRPVGLEVYHLIVLARDRGSPPMTGTMRVDVEVCDSNDNSPQLSSAAVCHCEHEVSLVTTLTAIDMDFGMNAEVDFTITFVDPVEHRDRFYLRNPISLVAMTDHMSTVEVFAAATLDREERDYYQIVVEAIDRGTPPQTGTGTVTVRVLDSNDHHPQWIETFPTPCRQIQLSEMQPEGYWIQSFSATDMDIGLNADLTYTLTQVATVPEGLGDYSSSFSLGMLDGVLRTTSTPLVYNDLQGKGIQLIMVTVTVQDRGPDTLPCIAGGEMECGGFSPGSNTAAVCINVSNTNTETPVCTAQGYKCILEHSDPDRGFLYDLSSFGCTDGDGTFPSGFLFTVEEGPVDHTLFQIKNNNQLCLADGVLPTLDRETDDEYNVVVVVSDRGYPVGDPLTSFITITICLTDINDNIPQFVDVPDACVRYAENVTGQDVVSLQVHDPDLDMNGEVTFMLTCTDKFGANCDGVFTFTREEINGIGIERTTIMHIRTAQHLDRETVDMFTLTIVAMDQTPCSAPGLMSATDPCRTNINICINVTDINDNRPNVTEHHCICIFEDATHPATLLNLTSNDRDLGENAEVSFMLVEGLLNLPFDVTTESPGHGTVRLVGSLDFEKQEFYSFLVAVFDRGSQSRRGRVDIYEYINVTVHVVNVPDQVPSIQDVHCNATENRTGEAICTLTATDADDGFVGCRCPNNNLNLTNTVFKDTIYFVFPDLSEHNNILTIHRDTGVVTVIRKLDREIIDFYNLTWGATNDLTTYSASPINVKTAYAHLFITVRDVNDNAPQFDYPFYIFAIDHDLEYGEEVATVSASDIDLGENKTVRYEFIHSFPHEPYFWINSTTGTVMTAGAFVWQIGNRFDFEVRAYDRNKQPENVVQDNEGWRYTDVPIAFYAAEDQTRVLVTVEEGAEDFTIDTSKQPCARNVLFTVTGHFIYVDRIRHAASDPYYDVTPEDADIVVHAVHPDSQSVLHGSELLGLLEADYVSLTNLLAQECGLTLLAVRLIPTVHDQTHIYVGLIVGVCVGVFFIICCCLLWGCICCWERRRRRTYQKRIATLSSLDQFSHSFYATKNPLFVPALGDAISESLDSGSIVDRENIIYASQELEVPMEEEMLEDDDWLKMDKPPEWLQPVEQEEYDEWTPPPRQPLLPPPPPEPQPESEIEIVTPLLEEQHEEVEVQQQVQQALVVQEEVTVQQEVEQEVIPIAVKRQRQKKKTTVEYEDQETILEVFADVDSEGADSDAELKMTAPPLEAFSDDEVDLEPDTFGAEAFQSTITSTDFTFDESTSLLPGEK